SAMALCVASRISLFERSRPILSSSDLKEQLNHRVFHQFHNSLHDENKAVVMKNRTKTHPILYRSSGVCIAVSSVNINGFVAISGK
ncbi:hypothetical protein LOD50_11995, partial [Xylella fastidiosa subsp. multiplex]|uniref:hypothetical protein n=1 Tax=Xylella fastidiosa TaxID=2371 RepID=UPI002360C06F